MDLFALRKEQLRELEQNICSDITGILKAKNTKLSFEFYCHWKDIRIDSYGTTIVTDCYGDEFNIENLPIAKKLELLHDMYHTF